MKLLPNPGMIVTFQEVSLQQFGPHLVPHRTQTSDLDHIFLCDDPVEANHRRTEAAMGQMSWTRTDLKNPTDTSIRPGGLPHKEARVYHGAAFRPSLRSSGRTRNLNEAPGSACVE